MALFNNEEEEDNIFAGVNFDDYLSTENQGLASLEGINFDQYMSGESPMSTLGASIELAKERQGFGGKETAQRISEVFGVDTGSLQNFFGGLEKEGSEALTKWKPSYIDKPFLESQNKPGWIAEQVGSQAGETGLIYGVSLLSRLMPGPIGSVVRGATIVPTYNSIYSETLQDIARKSNKDVSQLSTGDKQRAAIYAGLNTALELVIPFRTAKKAIPIKFTGNVKKDLKAVDKWLKSTTPDTKLQQTAKFSKELGKTGLGEMTTETLQGIVSSAASEPGISYEFTPEGMSEAVDRAVGGFFGGTTFGSPASIANATQVNRTRNQYNQLLTAGNRQKLLEAGENFKKTGKETTPRLFNVTPPKQIPVLSKLKDIGANTLFRRADALFNDKLNRFAQGGLTEKGNKPTGKDVNLLVNKLFPRFGEVESMSGDKQQGIGYDTYRMTLLGDYGTKFDNIYNKWRGGGNVLGRFNPAIDAYVGAKLEEGSGRVTAEQIAALEAQLPTNINKQDLDNDIATLREITDNVYGQLKETLAKSDMEIGYTKGYLPRGIDRKAIEANREGFIQSLVKDVGYNRKKAEAIANDIIKGRDPTILSSKEIRGYRKRKGEKKKGFEKERNLKWDALNPEFRNQSAFDSLQDYIYKATSRIASAEKFGGNKAEKLAADVDEALEKGLITSSEAKTIWDMYDAEHKRYGLPESPEQEALVETSRLLAAAASVKLLGLAILSSIPELAHMPSRVGFINTVKAAPKAAGFFMKGLMQSVYPGKTGKSLNNAFAKDLIQVMGMGLNPIVNERVEALMAGDVNPFMNWWFRSLGGGFLTQYTNFVRSWTAVAGMYMIQDEAKKVVNGTLKGKNKVALERELRENGLTLKDFEQIIRQGNNTIDFLDDTFLEKRFTKSDGTVTRVRDVLVPWLRKITTDVALEPRPTNRPLWMANPKLQLVAQLKSFPVVFANNIMKRTYRQLNPKVCTPGLQAGMSTYLSVALALSLAALAIEMKKGIRGDEDEELTVRELLAGAGVPYIDARNFSQIASIPAVSVVDGVFSPLFSTQEGEGLGDTVEEILNMLIKTTGGAILAEGVKSE